MRIVSILQLIVAMLMVLQGMHMYVRPHVLLDVVLTPAELADEATVDVTLALLKKAIGYDSACWLVLGSIVGGLAVIGMRQCKTAGDNSTEA